MNKERLKEIIKSKEGITLIGIITLLIVITLISISVNDTHAYYSSVTDPVQIFNSKVGNFKPKITSFYIKQSTSPKYTNLGSNIVYLTPGTNNKNIDQVCITETNNIDTCTWQNITSNNQYSYTFTNTNTEGNKIIFGFVKDKYGNKSLSSQDSIVYDKTTPTIKTITTSNLKETSVTLTVTANTDTSGIYQYCYSTSNSSTVTGTCQSSSSIQLKNLKDGTSYTYYLYLKDNAGNSGITNKKSYTFTTESVGPLNALKTTTDSDYLKTVTENDELLRYVGTQDDVEKGNLNNFICFGTNNESTCTSNKETYMYRIIGITTSGVNSKLGLAANQLKIIKATPLVDNTQYLRAWTYSYDNSYCGGPGAENGNCKWDYSGAPEKEKLLSWYLNNRFLSTITGNVSGSTTWASIIDSDVKWYVGDDTGARTTTGITNEKKAITSSTYKIGLMYASDYYNSWTYEDYPGNINSWLYISNGITGVGSCTEWTMTRWGYDTLYQNRYRAWYVHSDGFLDPYVLDGRHAVRPVFYLSSDVKLNGQGTEEHPFLISV